MKDVTIQVHNCQVVEGQDKDELEFYTDGIYEYEDGVALLTYMESELTGLPGTRTRLILKPEGITVVRDGTLNSRMDFAENTRNAFAYDTPYGNVVFGLITHKITQDFNEHGGHAVIEYMLDLEREPFSKNRFEFSVREQKSKYREELKS